MAFQDQYHPSVDEVAIPRCSLEKRTRSGPKSVDLDPSNFLRGLRNVSSSYLIETCEIDASPIKVKAVQSKFKLGDLIDKVEGQNVEYKFPEETWDFGKFVKKSLNKYLIVLLNGATDKDVELWLGVDHTGRILGGPGDVQTIKNAILHANLDCFPPVRKQDIVVEVYPLDVPSLDQDFVVEWYGTAKEAQHRIRHLEGRGWHTRRDGKESYGVVIANERGKTPKAFPADGDVLRKTEFQRVVCCVRARSIFREAYINRHVEIGTLLPFQVWLRSRMQQAVPFLDGLRSSCNIGFQIGGESITVEGARLYSRDEVCAEMLPKLARNPVKTRYVIFSLSSLQGLLRLILSDVEQQIQSVHYNKVLATWKVAPLLNLGDSLEALAAVKNALRAFSHVQVVEVLCEGYTYRPPEPKPGQFSKRTSFEVVGVKLPAYELSPNVEDALQFLLPQMPHSDISWATTKFLVVATSKVQQGFELVDKAIQSGARKRVIHVASNTGYSGLSTTLRKAAMIVAEQAPKDCSTLFLLDAYPGVDLSDLDTYLKLAEDQGRTCIIFQDAHRRDQKYDDALDRLLLAREYCCLIKGSCNTLISAQPDVAISCVWGAEDIRSYRDIFAPLKPNVVHLLDGVVEDAEKQGCCPFFVVPLVVNTGEYVPIKMRLEAQVTAFEDAQMSEIADCLAFISATCDETRVSSYLTFSRMLDDLGEEANQYSLLKTLDRKGTRTFVHPEAARSYIWIRLKKKLPSKHQTGFPLDEMPDFVKRVISHIETLSKSAKYGLLNEIFFERGTGDFSSFNAFLLLYPNLLDKIYTTDFIKDLMRHIPECDILILLARLSRNLQRHQAALDYASRSVSITENTKHWHKAVSCLAGVHFDRYRDLKAHEEYERCRACFEKLLKNEGDPGRAEQYMMRIGKLEELRHSIVTNVTGL